MMMKMEFLVFFICVIPVIVESITVSPNGNSPKVKMVAGMMVDVQKGFVPVTAISEETAATESNYEKSRKLSINSTNLSLNERYRRLIPYMTFYYANDVATPATENGKNIEVEKAQIVEANELGNQRQPKKIFYSQRNIPRYQGNRLTQYNIASSNPTKIYYKEGMPIYQIPNKATPNFNPLIPERPIAYDYDSGRMIPKLTAKSPGAAYQAPIKRPYLNVYNEETPNIRYYLAEKEQTPRYKLVPYEQTPPVKVPYSRPPTKISYETVIPSKMPYEHAKPVKVSYGHTPLKLSENHEEVQQKNKYEQRPEEVIYEQSPVKTTFEPFIRATHKPPARVPYDRKIPQRENVYEPRKPVIVSVLVPKELYVKPRPAHSFSYDDSNTHPVRKQPAIVSESYYEKQRPPTVVIEPLIESGFNPIAGPAEHTTEASIYTSTVYRAPVPSNSKIVKHPSKMPLEPSLETPETTPNYYQYDIDQPEHKLTKETAPSAVTLASLLNSLQINKSIPKTITRENVASSIRTLLQVLNTLKGQSDTTERPALSTPMPFVASKVVKIINSPEIEAPSNSEVLDPELHEEPYLAHVNTPSQHLDDNHFIGGTSQQFPLPVTSDDEGGTPGQPGIDYPILTTIPQTSFNCKTQRYKGFFADTETRCQVWHYCDLNGGQASFLCPNGTIFSQAGLTCDWWFNVRCDSTTQLYVLNESLYKYILPHSPKFPEDYSGPLVDKYLTLKFKEMEEELKKNKSKQSDKESEEEDEEDEDSDEATSNEKPKTTSETDKRQLSDLSKSSVIIEYPGSSGKVVRLEDE